MRAIRRHIMWAALLFAVPVAATAVYAVASCTVPLAECSDIYRRYADSPDVSAAYLKDYRVNDTLTLSATVLQAVNDTGWATLYNDFKLTLHKRKAQTNTLEKGDDILEIISLENGLGEGVASYRDKYICIFHIEDPKIKEQIVDALVDKMVESLINQNHFYQ